MKKLLIIGWCGLAISLATYAQSDYTTYQLAFRKGGIITVQPDFTGVTTVSEAYTRNNAPRQQWILKRRGDGSLLIASAAMPDRFLRREGDVVRAEAYDPAHAGDYGWVLSGTVSASHTVASTTEGDKLLATLADPAATQSVLVIQGDGSLAMGEEVDFTLSNDPYRLYVVKKTTPGSF